MKTEQRFNDMLPSCDAAACGQTAHSPDHVFCSQAIHTFAHMPRGSKHTAQPAPRLHNQAAHPFAHMRRGSKHAADPGSSVCGQAAHAFAHMRRGSKHAADPETCVCSQAAQLHVCMLRGLKHMPQNLDQAWAVRLLSCMYTCHKALMHATDLGSRLSSQAAHPFMHMLRGFKQAACTSSLTPCRSWVLMLRLWPCHCGSAEAAQLRR